MNIKTDNTNTPTDKPLWYHRAAIAVGTLLVCGIAFANTAHAADSSNTLLNRIKTQPQVTASATVVLTFERPKVVTVDTHPAKPASISVKSSIEKTKRPMPGTLSAPLAELHATSPFGLRVSPITGALQESHLGQDFGAACGTAVYAADSGKVVFAGWHKGGGGNRVEVDHGNGLTTSYNHMAANSVRVGDVVDVGAVVGQVGSTGASTGCHLHFETIEDSGERVDPAKWKLNAVSPK
jgi:murein DD-endopeptidase MepM/ murein hydrolase activator NlpD